MGTENESNHVDHHGDYKPWTSSTPSHPDPPPTDISSSLTEEQRLRSSNGDMWPLYSSQAEKNDLRLAERYKRQSDTTLYFAGLISIVVSIFLVRSIGALRPNSTELLLAQISLQLAQQSNATGTQSSLPNILSAPTSLDIATNTLWALSLVLSLSSALSATLVQEWLQEYLCHSQCHPIPSTRARIRAYLFNGLSRYYLDQVISAMPLLLHLAILLFGAGLISHFFALNHVVAYAALVAYSIASASYLLLAISPLISLSSPFKTPISNLFWRNGQLVRLTVLHVTQGFLSFVSPNSTFSRFRLPKIISAYRERYRGGIVRALEQDLESTHPNTDAHSLRWAILSMQGDDCALQSFIAAIPRFLDSERHNYPQYTIGSLLEDRDVRLGWGIGRLLQTCANASCALESHVRRGRAIACMRATWYITEKFVGMSSLFWDTLFGAETADSLSTLRNDNDSSIAIVARCTAALAARSCLHELTDVSAWTQTKGPHWANRAQHLAGYVIKLSGVTLPVEPPEILARDGPLLILSTFLTALSFSNAEADDDVSFMVSTTVEHLANGVRAGEAKLDVQKQFIGIFSSGTYDYVRRHLDPVASRAVRHIVAGLHQDLATRIPEDWDVVDPVLQERHGGGCPARHRSSAAWLSHNSSRTAFSGDATTSPPGFEPCHSPRNQSSLGTVAEVQSLPSHLEGA